MFHARLSEAYRQQGDRLWKIQGLALGPDREAGRRDQVVQGHRQPEAVVRREESIETEDADLVERRALDLVDQRGQIQVPARAPGVVEDRRQQDVLAARQRIGGDAIDGGSEGGRGGDAVANVVVGHEDALSVEVDTMVQIARESIAAVQAQ